VNARFFAYVVLAVVLGLLIYGALLRIDWRLFSGTHS